MVRIARFALALLLSAFSLLPDSGSAEEVSDADRTAIRSMIAGQIEAFRNDDGPEAYGFASPEIRAIFPSVEQFMAMVRNQYPPVYRPRSVIFGEVFNGADGLFQKVFLIGPEGKNWVAVYSLERQADGSWRISGCVLIRDSAPSI